MISLLPLPKLIAWIAAIYAMLVGLVAILLDLSGLGGITLAVKGVSVLNILLLLFAIFGWRHIWKRFPKLGEWVYPDLNGKWDVEIYWNWGNKSGTKPAVAYIRQSLIEFSIELESDESQSETLMVVPHKDAKSSRPGLYYIYRNEGKTGAAKKQNPHTGAAILKLDLNSCNELHGNYFTSRSTNGQYTLRRPAEY